MSTSAEQQAIRAAQDFLQAFNDQDHAALAATLNYPHVRLASGRFVTIASARDFVHLSETVVKESLESERWHHSVLRSIAVVHSGLDKVHMALTVDRCREDGSTYITFDTLWIATLQEGHWGIQFRSSYLRPLG